MEASDGEGPDSSSIVRFSALPKDEHKLTSAQKPVSSLRSRFENAGPATPDTQGGGSSKASRQDTLSAVKASIAQKKPPPAPPVARRSFDVRSDISPSRDHVARDAAQALLSPSGASSLRPQSMLIPSPPRLAVTAPASPPKPLQSHQGNVPEGRPSSRDSAMSRLDRPPLPVARHVRLASRSASRSTEALVSTESSQTITAHTRNAAVNSQSKPAPPINRAAKPGQLAIDDLPRPTAVPPGLQSPFDPPSRSPFGSSPEEDIDGDKVLSPPPVPTASKPGSSKYSTGSSQISKTNEAISVYRPHPPRLSSSNNPTLSHQRQRSRSSAADGDEPHDRPVLPPRLRQQEPLIRSHVHGVRSAGSRGSLDASNRPSALTQGFTRQGPVTPRKSSHPNPALTQLASDTPSRSLSRTPPPRPSADIPRSYKSESRPRQPLSESSQASALAVSTAASEYPDFSTANRRAPYFQRGPRMISTTYDSRLFDIRGEYVCTSGSHTRVWSLLTGKLMLSMAHGEQIRTNAIAFKPTRSIEAEGKLIWIGNNLGEVQEVDVTTKKVMALNNTAHARRELVKIYRNGPEMWTLDNEGKLIVWPAGQDGSPSLSKGIFNGRVPQGHTTSVVAEGQLWLACGRSLHVFQPSADPSTVTWKITDYALQTPGASDFISSTTVRSQPNKVFFGHVDGKVSVYSRADLSHIDTISISLHKVSCLVGVGDQLWAGFNTGLISTYDPSERPFKGLKSWKSHSQPILNLISDEDSLWKMGRWHVVSLGVDNLIGIWDGMLEQDWIEDYMRSSEPDYSSYERLAAAVFTWNAGAAKPTDLRYEHGAADFFRDFLKGGDLPDIMVFGLQELVDLEDKKLTAKSLFRSKKQDSYGNEHLRSVYRAWRDYLARCLDEYLPDTGGYAELHTASMVGLFTCVFVKADLRHRIRDLQAAQVKTGMGGLHGNKGALIVRFLFEDTSICFTNCHLAAGQASTTQRNNDVASILEATHLPLGRNSDFTSYICGGDGSMVMDHEICILNGDLNYRIDTMSRDTIVNAIRNQNLPKLLDRDQLMLSRRKFPGFRLRDFTEQTIKFRPTYKYDVGTDDYDTSEKRRSPAWCDRILYHSLGNVKQLDYKRHEIRVSDHRPVTAAFELRIKSVDTDRRQSVHSEADAQFAKHQAALADEAKVEYLSRMFHLSKGEARRKLHT